MEQCQHRVWGATPTDTSVVGRALVVIERDTTAADKSRLDFTKGGRSDDTSVWTVKEEQQEFCRSQDISQDSVFANIFTSLKDLSKKYMFPFQMYTLL